MSVENISDAFADILLDSWLTRSLTELPSSFFVGLTLSLPTDQNGSGLVEPTNAEYGRLEVLAESASWSSLGPRLRVLDLELLYAEAVTDWGVIVGYTLYDALTDGTFLGYGETNPFNITTGLRARIPSRSLVVAQTTNNARGGAPFWFDLTGDLPFPSEAISGDFGFDSITGDVWRNA